MGVRDSLGLPYNEKFVSTNKIKLKLDGTVSKTEIDHARMNKPGQGFYKVLVEVRYARSQNCVNHCEYPLQVTKMQEQLNFDAKEMLEVHYRNNV